MMEQVQLLKSNGDVQGLIRFFLDLELPGTSGKRRNEGLSAKGAAAGALAELGTPEAVDALASALEGAPSDSYLLANALAAARSPKAVEALIRMARDHQDLKVRNSAVLALADKVDGFADRREEVFDVLNSALDDPEWGVRHAVALRLRAKDPRAVDLLTRALADPDERVRNQAAGGLRFLGMTDERAGEAVRAADEDRRAALEGEVKALVQARGWSRLGLEGNPGSSLWAYALFGLIVGLGILLLLTRGDLEGVVELLGGGGGGVGLIIMAVSVVGVAIAGFFYTKSKEVRAGQASWDSWIASASDDDLIKAKAKLEQQT